MSLVSPWKAVFAFVDALHLLFSPLKPFAPHPLESTSFWMELEWGVVGVGGIFEPHFLLADLPALSLFLGPENLPLAWQTPGLGVCLADHATTGNRI